MLVGALRHRTDIERLGEVPVLHHALIGREGLPDDERGRAVACRRKRHGEVKPDGLDPLADLDQPFFQRPEPAEIGVIDDHPPDDARGEAGRHRAEDMVLEPGADRRHVDADPGFGRLGRKRRKRGRLVVRLEACIVQSELCAARRDHGENAQQRQVDEDPNDQPEHGLCISRKSWPGSI